MMPHPPRRNPARPDANLLYGTIIFLVVAFVALIALFYAFSSFSPSLLGQCVAVTEIDSELTVAGAPSSLFDPGMPGSEEIASRIEAVNGRDDVGALVIVVNSPGGSVVATREIYEAVKSVDKPKVAYFREVAASGGYYVATGTDYIISDPDALTGSIGVIATFTDMSGLLDKLGVNVTAVKSGPHKDIGSSFRDMTPEEQEILQGLVDEVYSEFKATVLINRGGRLDRALFEEVADGRVLSGRQAEAVGLVDETGNKKDAIMKAADMAGIEYQTYDDIQICQIPLYGESGSIFSAESLIRRLSASSGVRISFG